MREQVTAKSEASTTGLPGLYVEVYWGEELTEARTFREDIEEIVAGPSDSYPLPLYGFALPGETHLLAKRTATGYQIFPPPKTEAVQSRRGDAATKLKLAGDQPSIELTERSVTLTLTDGHLRIVIKASVAVKRVQKLELKDAITIGVILIAFLLAPIGFFFMGATDTAKLEAFNERALDAARQQNEARQKELDRLYPSLPAGSIDAGEDVKRVNLPAAISTQ